MDTCENKQDHNRNYYLNTTDFATGFIMEDPEPYLEISAEVDFLY